MRIHMYLYVCSSNVHLPYSPTRWSSFTKGFNLDLKMTVKISENIFSLIDGDQFFFLNELKYL